MLSFFIHWFVFLSHRRLFWFFFIKSLLFLPISYLPSCYFILSFINSFISYSIHFVHSFLKSNLFHSLFIHFSFVSLITFISFVVHALFIRCSDHIFSFIVLFISVHSSNYFFHSFLTFFLYSIFYLLQQLTVFPMCLFMLSSFPFYLSSNLFVSISVPQLPFWSLTSSVSWSPIFLLFPSLSVILYFSFQRVYFSVFPHLIVFYTSSRFFLLGFLQGCCWWWHRQRCKHQRLLFLSILPSFTSSLRVLLSTYPRRFLSSHYQFIFSLLNLVVSFFPSFSQIFALFSFCYRFFFFKLPLLSPFSF